MELKALEEGALVRLEWTQDRLYFEARIRIADEKLVKIVAHNSAVTPVGVQFSSLDLKAGFSDADGLPSLGEVEATGVTEDGFVLEGDFGCIQVLADTWRIEAAL